MRIGVPAALARATTSATLSGPPMLPGLRRTQCAPASIALSASVWLKWMSAMTGIGDCDDDRLQRLDVAVARDRDAHDVGAGLGHPADLVHRGRQVGGLRLGHRLHGDGRAAADRDAADRDLPRGGHDPDSTERLPCRADRRPMTSMAPPAGRCARLAAPVAAPRTGARATRELSPRTGLRPGMRVLDVGCGVLGLRALAPDLDITGVDVVARPDYPGPFVLRRRHRAPALRRRRVRPRLLRPA